MIQQGRSGHVQWFAQCISAPQIKRGFFDVEISGSRQRCDVENVSEDELRAFGLLDERISPSTVKRCFRSEAWAEVDRYQRFL
jgi:hypothetical protein